MAKCPYCRGTVGGETFVEEGRKILEVRCIHCGERFLSLDAQMEREARQARFTHVRRREVRQLISTG